MDIGYARVSTTEQSLDLHLDQLRAAGCHEFYSDVISGAKVERPGLAAAIAYAHADDRLVVWNLGRLGRSLQHLIETVAHLESRGIGFRSLTEGIDTTSPGGKLIFHVFGALADFERDLIRERTQAGLAAAHACGREGGLGLRQFCPTNSPVLQLVGEKSDTMMPEHDALPPMGIGHEPTIHRWALGTAGTTLALRITSTGLVVQDYWGPKLHYWSDIPSVGLAQDRSSHDVSSSVSAEVLPVFGGLRFGDYALKATFADGTRDLDLRYVAAVVGADGAAPTLTIRFRDGSFPLEVTLRYTLYPTEDVVVASTTIQNTGTEPVTLGRAFSATWHLPRTATPRTLTTLMGHWGGETRIHERPLGPGIEVLASRRGITSADMNPWFAVQERGDAAVTYVGALAWSGNWQMRLRTDVMGRTRITGGINDEDFAWQLGPGASFQTPDFVAACVPGQLNDARARLHRYVQGQVLPPVQRAKPRPVLYNSWEATYFAVTEEGQKQLAERAAVLGVELFVVDDGWFKGRTSDQAALGDWTPDPLKFPQGLGPLAEYVRSLGMQFGLWVEPEMVSPDSDLYRQHPDWVYHYAQRPRSTARHQLVLNVGRDDVRDHLTTTLDALVRDHGITFLKWDMNRSISEPGWPEHPERGSEIWVRHVQGVYAIMDALRARHPDLAIESCCSGGGRADYGILRRTDQIWTSDNTHPVDRLHIQEGFSLPFPPRVMVNWVTDTPQDRMRNEIPLAFRCHVAMLGTLGLGGDLSEWAAADLHSAAREVARYKQLRHLLQDGRLAWLRSLREGQSAAVQFTAPDASEIALLGFRVHDAYWEEVPPVRLHDLPPTARYRLQDDAADMTLSGAALMHAGVQLPLPAGSYASVVLHFVRV